MTDDRSLRDLLLESADDLECVVKKIVDTVINKDRKGGETALSLVEMFDSKQDSLKKLLLRVPAYQERENLIKELNDCVKERDGVIQDIELNLKACEVAITTAVFQANQKLKSVREAKHRKVNSETVVKLAHQISRHYSVSAPLSWQQGDPARPFPQEQEFRNGQLLNGKAQGYSIPGVLPSSIRSNSQSHGTPPTGATVSGSPIVNSIPPSQQKQWSPRSGYGPPPDSPIALVTRGMTPNQLHQAWPSGVAGTTDAALNKGNKSPTASPTMKIKITGISRVSAAPLPTVEQMSSDSSSSSSSDDEGGQN